MRIIKIGRSKLNDIVIGNMMVSSEHARITIDDTGRIQIRDLNSRNGTFVNGQKIFNETVIGSLDEVKVAGIVVDYIRFLNQNTTVVNNDTVINANSGKRKSIGRADVCDMVLAHNDVSGLHAYLVQDTNGNIIIQDNNSKNGTYVNNHKISSHTLKPGDVVLISNKYKLNWEDAFHGSPFSSTVVSSTGTPKAKSRRWLYFTTIPAAVLIIACLIFKPWNLINKDIDVYATYKSAVVLIYHSYYFEVSLNNEVLARYTTDGEKIYDFNGDNPVVITGTGFFISTTGEIITNRHVAYPWTEDTELCEKVKHSWQEKIAAASLQNKASYIRLQPEINNIKITGKTKDIGVFANNTYVKSLNDLMPCTVIKQAKEEEIDLALIQTNSKILPAEIKTYVHLSNAVTDRSELKEGNDVYTIGFPAGFNLASTEQGIQANCQSGKITQIRGNVEFGHNINIIGGASGSPVFNKQGRLTGIINRGFAKSQGYNMAIQAKHAVELVQ